MEISFTPCMSFGESLAVNLFSFLKARFTLCKMSCLLQLIASHTVQHWSNKPKYNIKFEVCRLCDDNANWIEGYDTSQSNIFSMGRISVRHTCTPLFWQIKTMTLKESWALTIAAFMCLDYEECLHTRDDGKEASLVADSVCLGLASVSRGSARHFCWLVGGRES